MRSLRVIYFLTLCTAAASFGMPAVTAFQKAETTPELKAEELYQANHKGVMTLTVHRKDGSTVTGSAFLAIQDGLAVTAWHVVNNAERVTARFASGEEFEVSGLVDKDVRRDMALIRVKVFGRQLLPTHAEDPPVGAKAFVIGAPKGLEFSITDGVVSQIRMEGGSKVLQFTCPTSPGNSGGPLFNAQGKVIGVVSFQRTDGQNLNFAYPITYALGLDKTLATQTWEMVKPEKSEPPDLDTRRPEPLPPPEFKAPATKRYGIRMKLPKNEPFTLRLPPYQERDLKTVEVAVGKTKLSRVTGEPAEKNQYSISDLGVFTFHSGQKGKEVLITTDCTPHRVAVMILGDPSSNDLRDALRKRLEGWGDEVILGAEVDAVVEKAWKEQGGYRSIVKQLGCDRLIRAQTSTTSEYVEAGAGSYYFMVTRVDLVAYDLLTGTKSFEQSSKWTGECSVFTGQRGFRQDLVKSCVATIIDSMAGDN